MTAKFTLDEIQKQIDTKFGQGLIIILPNQTYTGIREPLKFMDRDYGEWEIAPFNIIQNGNTHPERSKARRKQTNLNDGRELWLLKTFPDRRAGAKHLH